MAGSRDRPMLHQHRTYGKMSDLSCGEPVVAKAVHVHLAPDTRKSSPVHAKTQPSAKGCGSAAASTVKVTRQSVFWSVRSHNRYPGCSVKLTLSISWRTVGSIKRPSHHGCGGLDVATNSRLAAKEALIQGAFRAPSAVATHIVLVSFPDAP